MVLDDIGEVCLGDQSISLTKHSLHSLSRTDAEPFISQVSYHRFGAMRDDAAFRLTLLFVLYYQGLMEELLD